MIGALALVIKRDWRHHRLRLVLTILGIALGVAVFFAVQTSNKTLVSALHTTIEKLAGKATLQVTGGEVGFSQDIVKTVRDTPGVQLAEPATETMAATTSPFQEKILVIGIDTSSDLKLYADMFDQGGVVVKNPLAFTSRTDSIAVTNVFAQRFKLKEGDKLTLQTRDGTSDFTVRGFFKASGAGAVFDGNVAVMDIYAAQDAFGRGSRIDRIDVMNAPDVPIETLQQRLTERLPTGVRAERPNLRGQSLENSVSSMHFGLVLMSFLALILGVFIIFNSFSISLNQRWKQIGILRALGVERGQIQKMFLTEAAIMGVIGSAGGIAIGFYLAKASMSLVFNVSSSVYGVISSPEPLEFNYIHAAEAFAIGLVASLIAAWLPARSAARLDPVLALHNIETRQSENVIGWFQITAGVTLVAGGLVLVWVNLAGVDQTIPLFYNIIITFGMILLLPVMISAGAFLLRPVLSLFFGAEGLIAVETMARAPRRTASTVGALMIGLAFVFGQGAFIYSQKAALYRSLDKAINADVFVTASDQLHSRTYHFSEETARRISSLPDIATADEIRIASIEYGGEEITVMAHDMNSYFAVSPDLLDIGDPQTARAATSSGEGILISRNLAFRWNISMGDTMKLETPGGTLSLPVVGMLDYYQSEKGTIFLDRSLFKKYWRDTDVDYVFINLKPGVDRQAFKSSVQSVILGEQDAFIYTHEEYKVWISNIVDQYFALTYLQMVIAIFVAAIGLINTMVISVAERNREIGIFRSIGGLRRQVVKMVLLEAVAISLVGLMTGVIAGIFNTYFLVYTAAKVVAGFSIRMKFPISMVLAAVPFVILFAIISAWLPARKAARLNVVEAIGYE